MEVSIPAGVFIDIYTNLSANQHHNNEELIDRSSLSPMIRCLLDIAYDTSRMQFLIIR